jgi:hypothetical protein
MTSAHDRLQRETGQAGSHESLSMDVGDVVLEMPSAAAGPPAGLTGARLLRVADCTVRPDHEEHFRGVQQQVWAPAMTRADGMLGGMFVRLASGRSPAVSETFAGPARGRRRDRGPGYSQER